MIRKLDEFELREIVDRKLVALLRFLALSARENPSKTVTPEDLDHYANCIERQI
ncbi:MAG: hypothetical protein H0X39_16735 [Actinobacteria bacterium]|nr:hypothetical protein [Actinomycetota bacterium]